MRLTPPHFYTFANSKSASFVDMINQLQSSCPIHFRSKTDFSTSRYNTLNSYPGKQVLLPYFLLPTGPSSRCITTYYAKPVDRTSDSVDSYVNSRVGRRVYTRAVEFAQIQHGHRWWLNDVPNQTSTAGNSGPTHRGKGVFNFRRRLFNVYPQFFGRF